MESPYWPWSRCERCLRFESASGAVLPPDRSLPRLSYLDDVFGGLFKTSYANAGNTIELAQQADLIIGAVLVPGAAAPKLITRAQLSELKPGAALVHVAIDQGGCFETSKATTHADPTYIIDGVVHYCVANMPGAVSRTSTYALNATTLVHAKRIAKMGWKAALKADPNLLNGLNVCEGKLTYAAVGEALGLDYVEASSCL